MNIFTSSVTAIATLGANIFNWVTKRSDLKNSQPMQQAKIQQEEQEQVNKTAEAINKQDTSKIRNELSELCVLFGLIAFFATACTTVVPQPVVSSAPSWDTTNYNSGFYGFTTNGTGLISAHARDRYNGLIQRYGTNFIPALMQDAGITRRDGYVGVLVDKGKTNAFTWNGELFEIDAEHLTDFSTMNRWRREGR